MPEPALQPTQEIGAPVDDFTLPAIGGAPFSLAALLEGKRGGVIVFWSGVCSHCRRYDVYFNGFAARRPEIAFAAIASRDGETVQQIGATIASRRISPGPRSKRPTDKNTPRVSSIYRSRARQ